jgi:hypothetical protein
MRNYYAITESGKIIWFNDLSARNKYFVKNPGARKITNTEGKRIKRNKITDKYANLWE